MGDNILKCEACGVVSSDVVRYQQRTMYPDPEANMATLCPACKQHNDEYWDEMWAEIHGNILS